VHGRVGEQSVGSQGLRDEQSVQGAGSWACRALGKVKVSGYYEFAL
jgi:hypothetical protein